MKNKKKAFTLTELLVVVIVIGVLSAAVLPKFSKVIETRKTTEAEELMASVRTEQEKRCALDKPYLTDLSQMNDIVKTASTKNYQINLQNKGINAASKGNYSYTLQMPSYADGRICCDGADCEKLNKNYPSCTDLTAKADYQSSPDSCAGTVTPVEPEIKSCSGSSTQACGCQNKGTQSRTCNTTTGEWSDWGACSVSDECECTGNATQACGCEGKGTQSRTCNTTTGNWSDWGECSISEECICENLPPKMEETSPCGAEWDQGTMKRTFNVESCSWGEWDESGCYCPYSEEPKAEDYVTTCNLCGETDFGSWCDEEKKKWVVETDDSFCSVQDARECYSYEWKFEGGKSCVRNMGVYQFGYFATPSAGSSAGSVSCFADSYGTNQGYGTGISMPADNYNLTAGCSRVISEAKDLYQVDVISLGNASPYSSTWNKNCTYKQEGFIGYGHQACNSGGASQCRESKTDGYGCYAFVCTKGDLIKK